MLLSLVRVEEKLLLRAFEERGVPVTVLDDRDLVFDLHGRNRWRRFDVVLERCINHSRALYALRILNDFGVTTVNSYGVALVCGNKLDSTSAPVRHGDHPGLPGTAALRRHATGAVRPFRGSPASSRRARGGPDVSLAEYLRAIAVLRGTLRRLFQGG